jgi:peptidoglycan/xylan/chitin deacetylase (PgdA/CDA1 family)
MSDRALILTYHQIEPGPAPLCIEPALFRTHLDVIDRAGARVVPLGELVDLLDRGDDDQRPVVAITFDDGFASAIDQAVPALAERGMPATVFGVAAHLGGINDWPAEPPTSPRRPLASAAALADAVGEGIALGSHGTSHAPLNLTAEDVLRREVIDSREALEAATGAPVRWFAYPYGTVPGRRVRALVERTYEGACAGGNRHVDAGDDRFLLPRVDPHYLRRPSLLARALEGDSGYLRLRRIGARARRLVRKDYRT